MPTLQLDQDKAITWMQEIFRNTPKDLQLRLKDASSFKPYDYDAKVVGYRQALVWPFAKTIAPLNQLLVLGMGGPTCHIQQNKITTIDKSEPRDFVKQGGLSKNYVNCIANINSTRDAYFVEYIGRHLKLVGETHHMLFGEAFIQKALDLRFGKKLVDQPVLIHFDSESMLIPPKKAGVLDETKNICEILQSRCAKNYGMLVNFTAQHERSTIEERNANIKLYLQTVQNIDWAYYGVKLLLNNKQFYETTTNPTCRMFAFKLLRSRNV